MPFVLILARPPLFHRTGWLGTPDTRGLWFTSSFSGASPMPWAIVTFSRGQHAVHAVGGHCELREAWVPAFQDAGSVNIPARRKRESGLLRPRTFHLGQDVQCPLWTWTGQKMKCLSEWPKGLLAERYTMDGILAFGLTAWGPFWSVVTAAAPAPAAGLLPASLHCTCPSPSLSPSHRWGFGRHREGDVGAARPEQRSFPSLLL